jgi:capsular exopolysaccharide synthesis family protein
VPEQSHVLDYLRVLSKRRWTALSVFIAAVVAAFLYTSLVSPTYEARVQLMIEDERPRVVLFKDAVDQDSDKLDYQQTQVAILQSRGLAKRTIEALNLWTNPEFKPQPRKTGSIARIFDTSAAMASSLGSAISKSAPPKNSGGAPIKDDAPERAGEAPVIDAFLSRLSVSVVRNSRLVDLRFQSHNPTLAAAAANALADAYTKQDLEYKSSSAKQEADWLGSQLEEQRKKVEASQAALQHYREQTASLAHGGADDAAQAKLNDLNASVMRAKTERIQKEALYHQVEDLKNDPSRLDSAPVIMANSFVQTLKAQLSDLLRQQAQLRGTLGDRHPEMVKLRQSIDSTQTRLRAEVSKAVDVLQQDYLAAQAQEQALTDALEAQKREALLLQRKQVDSDALEHAATTDRQIFETLLQRTKETGVAGQTIGSGVRIIDRADVPRRPISPRKDRDLLVAVLGGAMMAVGLAFFVDYLDKTIQTPDELRIQLGLPCLGLVPKTEITEGADDLLVTNESAPPRFRESFRTVRTNVLFASSREDIRTLLVTSTGPGEGKTLVATNLAIALAQTGQEVLLIDGDMRRPMVSQALGVPSQPGLAEVLAGQIEPESAARPTAVQHLTVMAAGAFPHNAGELLSAPRVKDVLAALAAQYAWVVIDSPPVMAVADASLIASIAGGVLFVVAAEQTASPLASHALDQLDTASARFLGAVLNRVDLERNAFFYASYYRHEYDRYYGQPA